MTTTPASRSRTPFLATVLVGAGFTLFQLVMGSVRALSDRGPSSDRMMAWLLVAMAAVALVGWAVAAVSGTRVTWRQSGRVGVAEGAHLATGMTYFTILPTGVAVGVPALLVTVVLAIGLSIALPPAVRRLVS